MNNMSVKVNVLRFISLIKHRTRVIPHEPIQNTSNLLTEKVKQTSLNTIKREK